MKNKNSKILKKIESIDWKSPIVSILIAIGILIVVFALLNKNFLKFENIVTIFLNASLIGIFASGVTMVIISGAIDLSTCAVAAVSAMLFGLLYSLGVPIWIGCIAGIGASAICGLINGVLIAKVKLSSLIVTIATSLVLRAVAYAFTDVKTVMIVNEPFYAFGRAYVFGIIPISVVYMIIIFFGIGFLLEKTTFGRKVYAIGGNMTASYYNGINIERTQIIIFIIMACISGFAGIVSTAQSAAASPNTMNGREFDFISPCILGGIAMSGGKGKMFGTFIGSIAMALIANGMVLAGLQSYYQSLVKGLILIFAMCVDALRNRQSYV